MPASQNPCCVILDQALDALRRSGVSLESAPALREPRRLWSYARLHAEACRAAGALRSLQLQPGARLLLLMHDGMELCAVLLGALRAGLCPTPVPSTLRPQELQQVLVDAKPEAALAHGDLVESLALLAPRAPSLRLLLSLGAGGGGPTLDYGALHAQAEPYYGAADPASPALLLYETGPSGAMRGLGFSAAAIAGSCDHAAASPVRLLQDDRVFCSQRLSTPAGLGTSLFFPLRAGAVSYLLSDPARPRAVFDVLGSFYPSVLAATGRLYQALLQEFLELSAPRPSYFRSIRLALSEPLPSAVQRRVRALFQLDPIPCFSIPELLHPVFCGDPGAAEPTPLGACGHPLPALHVRLCDENGRPMHGRVTEPGHLQVREAEDAWLCTPERFFCDAEGRYYSMGRTDGLFRVDERLVAPLEVEQTLLGHPAVWECALVEDTDEDGLAVAKAFVVLNVGRAPSAALARELLDFVRGQLSPHKVPRALEFLPHLPRTPDGKVARWRLRTPRPTPPPEAPSSRTPLRTPPSGSKPSSKPPRKP